MLRMYDLPQDFQTVQQRGQYLIARPLILSGNHMEMAATILCSVVTETIRFCYIYGKFANNLYATHTKQISTYIAS